MLLLIASIVIAPLSFAQSKTPRQTLREATDTANQIEAVTGGASSGKAPAGDPCALLPAAEVKKAFPAVAAIAPQRSQRLEKYGITECVWKGAKDQILLVVQESTAKKATQAREEVLGMAQGFVDPVKPGALKNIRIEKFTAPGIDSAAFVETADPARGILSDGAYLALVKGSRVVTLMSPELTSRDRDAALKALENLGAATAKSMN